MTAGDEARYRGRFAPSPTGPLHLGSLVTAVASYADARSEGGRWLLRIEDIDPPREQPGAAAAIASSLRRHDLHWDGPLSYQRQHHRAYEHALTRLGELDLLMRCYCSRRELGPDGSCRGRCGGHGEGPSALRVRVDSDWSAAWHDRFQGPQEAALPADFVVRRRDGYYAYQLAVVVDDFHQAISHVVRGADLLPVTSRQRYLQHVLGYPSPRYAHCPLLLGQDGRKLSKQNRAAPLDDDCAADNLRQVVALLHQEPAPKSADTPAAILAHAIHHWSPAALRGEIAVLDSHDTAPQQR